MPVYISTHLQDFMKYQLNDNRIARILQVENLDEATRMGIFDRINDYFNGNAKQESIRKLFEQVTSPDNTYASQPLRVINRFCKLRLLAKEEFQPEFCIDIKTSPFDETWGNYLLRIGEKIIFQSETLDKKNNDFYEIAVLAKCIDCINWYMVYAKENCLLEKNIESCIECMSDEINVQKKLYKHLDDTRFSSTEFRKISLHKDKDKFIAHFNRDNLVLSNRGNENYEYRGKFLQNELKNPNFTNLRDLISKCSGTEKDSFLCYAASPFKLELVSILGGDTCFSSERLRAIAYSQKLAKTSVGALWKLVEPA